MSPKPKVRAVQALQALERLRQIVGELPSLVVDAYVLAAPSRLESQVGADLD